MKSENKYAGFFHLHPEVPAVAVVLAMFLFAGIGAPKVVRRLALPWSGDGTATVWTAHSLLQKSVSAMPKVLTETDCQAQRRRDAIRKYLRRELEERARQKAPESSLTPRRSRVELI